MTPVIAFLFKFISSAAGEKLLLALLHKLVKASDSKIDDQVLEVVDSVLNPVKEIPPVEKEGV